MDRPDPLAPPEGYGARPGGQGPDLSVCSEIVDPETGERCSEPPSAVIWIGCTAGEHAGPLAFCGRHARRLLEMAPFLVCGQCQAKGMPASQAGRARLLRVTDMSGRELPLPAMADTEVVQRALDFALKPPAGRGR